MKTDDLLLLAARLIGAGECEDAAKVLGDAMMTAKRRGKRCVIAMLEEITEQSAAASCNLALALLRGDGIKADPQRGARLLHDKRQNNKVRGSYIERDEHSSVESAFDDWRTARSNSSSSWAVSGSTDLGTRGARDGGHDAKVLLRFGVLE